MTVYLLHFDRAYKHARHYIGSTRSLKRRIAEHKAGRGARIMEVVTKAGIGFSVARTWKGGRKEERRLKNRHNAPQLCPLCKGGKA